MTLATIPSGFVPQVQGYNIGSPSGVRSTSVAGGAPRNGLEYDRGPQLFQATLILDDLELGVWTVWYQRIIRNGAYPFSMDLNSGTGPQPHECQMVPGSYSALPVGGGALWSVSFVVTATSAAYQYSDADAQTLMDLWDVAGGDLYDVLARLEKFVNVDTLVMKY